MAKELEKDPEADTGLGKKMIMLSWCGNLLLQDIFPSGFSVVIFVAYMALFVNQGLIITASRNGATVYPFDPVVVVLLAEILKFSFAVVSYVSRQSVTRLMADIAKNKVVWVCYIVPALLYCVYNNLSFNSLSFFDPTTYFMFLQTRLLLTGVIYQCLFDVKLSTKQWFSLVILTVGCILQKMDLRGDAVDRDAAHETPGSAQNSAQLWQGFFYLILQVCSSVFAGVYNEYIIKKVASESLDIMIQNVFMTINSMVCNLAVLYWKLYSSETFSSEADNFSLNSLMQWYVVGIAVNNAAIGIVTSLFLKNFNSILKAFASAMELVFTSILSFLLLGIPINWNTAAAVSVVSLAVVMYATNPLKVLPRESQQQLQREPSRHILEIKETGGSFGR